MKKICRFLSFLLCILVVSSLPAQVFADDATGPYVVDAKAAMLIDLDSERVLFSQDADEKIYPASLTKIMTCMLALENADEDQIVTVSSQAVEDLGEDSSSAGLLAGEQISLRELLYCVMISSANEACNVVAETVSGSVSAFVDLMNQRARELGCTGTHFVNPHGLHDDNHYTTARDLSKITLAALKLEDFVTICTAAEHTVPATNLSAERELHSTNYLISTYNTEIYYYAKAKGIKTGFTTPAGRCLISMASSGGLNFLSIVCGAATVQQSDGSWLMKSFTETKNLFEYGFSHYREFTLVTPLRPLGKLPVRLSADTESAVYAPAEAISALLPSEYDELLLRTVINLDNPEGIDAPVRKDQKLGTVEVYYDHELLGSTDLLAIADIQRSATEQVISQTQSFFHAPFWKWVQYALVLLVIVLIALLVWRIYRIRMARQRRAEQRKREELRRRLREEMEDQ